MSIVARSSLPIARAPLLSLAVGVAVAEALIDVAGVDARLKWPNDVLIRGRKVSGILLERNGDVVLIGIGINVAQRTVPAALEAIATSVLLAGGKADRDAIAQAVLGQVSEWRTRLEGDGFDPIRERWMTLTSMRDQRVSVDGVSGRFVGLDEAGALLLDSDGETVRVIAGEVQPLPVVDTPEDTAYTARNLV